MLRYIFLSVFALLLLTACGGSDLDKLIETKECVRNSVACDLSRADLSGADLTRANLVDANLNQANGADFTGALNVPAKYLKD